MRSEEFLHILTRVVNSPAGPRFLQIIHELRELLEDAGIAEEAASKLEPGKPIRRRSQEKVIPPELREVPSPPAGCVQRGEAPRQEAPEAPEMAAAAVIGESPDSTESEIYPVEPVEDFIEAAPGRYVRRREAPPAGESPPGRAQKESVRSIVLSALQEGGKTMAELKEIVREKKGQVSHLNQQIHQALRKIEAYKIGKGKFSLTPESAGESSEYKQLNILDELPDSSESRSTPEEPGNSGEEPPPASPDPA